MSSNSTEFFRNYYRHNTTDMYASASAGERPSNPLKSKPSVYGELTVYSWGRGEDGQLGIGDTSDQHEPTYVDSLRGVGVKEIACGSGHTVVLTGEGEVYTWCVS